MFALLVHMKCFGCGEAGHLIKMCPHTAKSAQSGSGDRPAVAEPPVAEPRAAVDQFVTRAEGPGADRATAPVSSDGNTGEGEQVGEKGEVCVEVGERVNEQGKVGFQESEVCGAVVEQLKLLG